MAFNDEISENNENDNNQQDIILSDENEEMIQTINDEQGIKVHYTINYDKAFACVKFIDKKKNLFKRVVYTVLMVGLAIYFLINIIVSQAINNNFFIMTVLLAFTLVIWIMPYSMMRKKAQAFDSIKEGFDITFFDTGFGVGKQNNTIYDYTDGISVQETEDMFILSVRYESIFPVSKENMTTEEISNLREIFKRQLGEKYENVVK